MKILEYADCKILAVCALLAGAAGCHVYGPHERRTVRPNVSQYQHHMGSTTVVHEAPPPKGHEENRMKDHDDRDRKHHDAKDQRQKSKQPEVKQSQQKQPQQKQPQQKQPQQKPAGKPSK